MKIDSFAYMPVQDFGNAFSTFIAQNYGAGEQERMRAGLRGAVKASICFCILISALIWLLGEPLMTLFIDAREAAVIAEGVRYLRIEGSFYCGIGCLFLLYGLYPGRRAAGHVRGADGGLAGYARGAGLRALRHPRLGGGGHLVVGAHRLVPGRHDGAFSTTGARKQRLFALPGRAG